jgi:hypothetical protein
VARAYTVATTERLLRNYTQIRNVIAGNAPQQSNENAYLTARTSFMREQPLGQGPRDERPWPFMEKKHARGVRDGKAQARAREELWVSVIDVEEALFAVDKDGHPLIQPDDNFILIQYYIHQNFTLDEMCKKFGVTSRGSMQRRCLRAVERLVRILESPRVT